MRSNALPVFVDGQCIGLFSDPPIVHDPRISIGGLQSHDHASKEKPWTLRTSELLPLIKCAGLLRFKWRWYLRDRSIATTVAAAPCRGPWPTVETFQQLSSHEVATAIQPEWLAVAPLGALWFVALTATGRCHARQSAIVPLGLGLYCAEQKRATDTRCRTPSLARDGRSRRSTVVSGRACGGRGRGGFD